MVAISPGSTESNLTLWLGYLRIQASPDNFAPRLRELCPIDQESEMSLVRQLEKIQDDLRKGAFTSEAAVSQGILFPILSGLGWPVFDTSVVIPEYVIEGRRVDFALCHPKLRPAIFVEVKKVGLSDGADRQLFEYAFHLGVPMAILTDGQEWSFFIPAGKGRYDERRVYKLDLLERKIDEAQRRLERYLAYRSVCSGDALKAANSDYEDVARHRIIKENIPAAWKSILSDQDSLIVELLADEVESICGYKPDFDICSKFLADQAKHANIDIGAGPPEKTPVAGHPEKPTIRRTPRPDRIFEYKGENINVSSARDVMVQLFERLAKEDSGFLERFASRKHGRKRRYLARDKLDLYPDRIDLAEQYSVEIGNGWWLGTNYSRKNIQDIIDLALEVANPELKAQIHIRLD